MGVQFEPEPVTSLVRNTHLCVSHETIYKCLFIQTRGLFRKEMRNHLRVIPPFLMEAASRPYAACANF